MVGTLIVSNGTASYEGGAVGVYVKNAFDSDGVIDTATSGHFKADASLMAYFGQVYDANDASKGTLAPKLAEHRHRNNR